MPEIGGQTIDPSALSVADAARLLTKAGGRIVTAAAIERDLENGAPTNADGTINLVHFTAWQVREMAHHGD